MATMALDDPPIPLMPIAVRMLLVCKMSRVTIMRVRRMLSESEIEKYEIPNQALWVRFATQQTNVIPSAILSMLAQSTTPGPWRARMRTHGTKIHDAGEGEDAEVLGIDNVATIELGEEPGLDTRVSECGVKQRANHKAIG